MFMIAKAEFSICSSRNVFAERKKKHSLNDDLEGYRFHPAANGLTSYFQHHAKEKAFYTRSLLQALHTLLVMLIKRLESY